jgi:hypothetical protein
VYVYTLPSANGAPAKDVMQGLYRRWRMRDRELCDGMATIFLFAREREARVMLGQGAPTRLKEALPDFDGELSTVFREDPGPPNEAALLSVIASIRKAIEGPTTWLDSPPGPSDPGPLCGFPKLETELMVSLAVSAASRETGHEIVFAINPPKGMDSSEQRSAKLVAAWPEKTVFIVIREPAGGGRVGLYPAASLKTLFSEESAEIIQEKVFQAMQLGSSDARFTAALVRAADEIRDAMKGHPPQRFDARRHPWEAFSGGPDEELVPLPLFLGVIGVVLTALFFSIRFVIRNPRAVAVAIALGLVEGLIGGVLEGVGGGGSGSSGGGFSGGGGSSGGGGASGSW